MTQGKILFEAMEVLSCKSMKLLKKSFNIMKYYKRWEELVDDKLIVYVQNKKYPESSVYKFCNNNRCGCKECIANDMQCTHELIYDNCFVIEKWGTRHFQEMYYVSEIKYRDLDNIEKDSDTEDNDDKKAFPLHDSDDNDLNPNVLCSDSEKDVFSSDDSQSENSNSPVNQSSTNLKKVSYQDTYALFKEICSMVSTSQKQVETFYSALAIMKGLFRQDKKYTHTTSDGWNLLFEQTKSILNKNHPLVQRTVEVHTKSPVKRIVNTRGGRPKEKRLKPRLEKLKLPKKMSQRKDNAHFVVGLTIEEELV